MGNAPSGSMRPAQEVAGAAPNSVGSGSATLHRPRSVPDMGPNGYDHGDEGDPARPCNVEQGCYERGEPGDAEHDADDSVGLGTGHFVLLRL